MLEVLTRSTPYCIQMPFNIYQNTSEPYVYFWFCSVFMGLWLKPRTFKQYTSHKIAKCLECLCVSIRTCMCVHMHVCVRVCALACVHAWGPECQRTTFSSLLPLCPCFCPMLCWLCELLHPAFHMCSGNELRASELFAKQFYPWAILLALSYSYWPWWRLRQEDRKFNARQGYMMRNYLKSGGGGGGLLIRIPVVISH